MKQIRTHAKRRSFGHRVRVPYSNIPACCWMREWCCFVVSPNSKRVESNRAEPTTASNNRIERLPSSCAAVQFNRVRHTVQTHTFHCGFVRRNVVVVVAGRGLPLDARVLLCIISLEFNSSPHRRRPLLSRHRFACVLYCGRSLVWCRSRWPFFIAIPVKKAKKEFQISKLHRRSGSEVRKVYKRRRSQ